MVWTVDKGILRLREQLDTAYPNRSHASDGTIGDAAHSARASDHNPESPAPTGNPDQQVDAGDFTQDPAHGADMGVVSEAIRQSKDRRVKYVIFNRRIFSGTHEAQRAGLPAFVWGPYSGSDPHTGHMHVSVEDDTHDQAQDWQITLEAPVTDVALTPTQAQQLAALDRRMRALMRMELLPYLAGWTDSPTDTETMELAVVVDRIDRNVAAIKANPPGAVTISDEQLERVLRKVLGGVDGASPAP